MCRGDLAYRQALLHIFSYSYSEYFLPLENFRPHIVSHTFDVHFNRVLSPGTTDLRPLLESNEWLKAGKPMIKELFSPGDFNVKLKLKHEVRFPQKRWTDMRLFSSDWRARASNSCGCIERVTGLRMVNHPMCTWPHLM